MLFDLIIINFNTPDLTINCVESAQKTYSKDEFNIIIVDNNSNDDSIFQFNKKLRDVTIIETGNNLGYSGALNEGVKYAKSNVFILSNSDIVFLENSIERMIKPIIEGRADITGPQLLYPNNLWQESYNKFPGYKLGLTDLFLINTIKRNYLRKFFKINSHNGKESLQKQDLVLIKYKIPLFASLIFPLCKRGLRGICLFLRFLTFKKLTFCTESKMKKVDFVDGAIMTVSREIFEKVGGFDPEFSFYSEETAFSYQATELGARIYHIPDSILIHYRGASYGIKKIPIDYIEKMIYSKLKFCRKFLSKNETLFYINCEKYHFFTLHTLSKFAKHKDTKYGGNYYEIYKIWDKVLNEV